MRGSSDYDFDELVRQHAALVARIASTYERRPALIEELTQDVFLAIHRALPDFRGDASIKTFIARIANNIGVSHVRRAARGPRETGIESAMQLADPSGDQEQQTDLLLKRERLLAAVRALDLNLRQVASLHLEGFTNAEIAETLSLSANNVGVRLHRARQEIAAQIAKTSSKEIVS